MNSKPLQVAIVDDDYSSIFIAQEYLYHCLPNASISGHVNPQEAINALCKKDDLDLLFLDLKMPNLDGFRFLELWSELENSKTRVYVLTSSIDPKDKERALNYPSVNGYFTKPLTTENIHTAMRSLSGIKTP